VTDDVERTWRARVAALSASQRRALAAHLTRDGSPPARERLVGFVVSDAAVPPTDEVLRAFMGSRLPDYMVPSQFVAVGQLPRTAAGKLDRRALSTLAGVDLRAAPVAATATPQALSATEATLATIWADVLKVDHVGIDDDFFEIGGDSLLSIRVIARAGRAGLRISPERFFERPTVRHMAASLAAASTPDVSKSSSPAAPTTAPLGEAPLTPIQHWFLDAIPEHRDWWNQAYVLELGHAVDAAALREITRLLVREHHALRLRLVANEGSWRQEFVAPDDAVPFRVVTLDGATPDACAAALRVEGEREHASLRLEQGSLFRVVLFNGPGAWRRVLLLGHHIVLDGISWQVILEDLATLMAQALSGQPLHLPGAVHGTSARAWALGLETFAITPAAAHDAHVWYHRPPDDEAMPVDGLEIASDTGGPQPHVPNRQGDAEVITLVLGTEETRTLLHDAPARLDSTAQSLLLTALLLAWHERTGHRALRLDLEGHGRDVINGDVSRTVGWFTTVFPVQLRLPPNASTAASITATAREVRRELDALPMRGAAHGLLRYLGPDAARRGLGAISRPALLFNYLGTHDLTLPAASQLRVTGEESGRQRSPDLTRPYLVEINCRVQDGRLVLVLEYARTVHRRATMEHFVRALHQALVRIADAAPAAHALSGLDTAGLQTVADLLGALDASEADAMDERASR
jgi:non-ribosomal peptide synthase protein (TIGR01720 family)